MTENEKRCAELDRLRAMPKQLSRGKWAVAVGGMRGWMTDATLGDGITSAHYALVTRCETREEAEALAARWNDAQPGVMPGSPSVFIFEAMPYRRNDYISGQNIQRSQTRDVDRRIFGA